MAVEASWPQNIPAVPLADGYSRSVDYGVIFSDRELGPPLARRRWTRPRFRWTHRMRLTDQQLDEFQTWVDLDIEGGVRAFETVHPERGTPIVARFLSQPTYERRGVWTFVTVELEEVAV